MPPDVMQTLAELAHVEDNVSQVVPPKAVTPKVVDSQQESTKTQTPQQQPTLKRIKFKNPMRINQRSNQED
jgi:hypothetical protein